MGTYAPVLDCVRDDIRCDNALDSGIYAVEY